MTHARHRQFLKDVEIEIRRARALREELEKLMGKEKLQEILDLADQLREKGYGPVEVIQEGIDKHKKGLI